MSEVKANMSPRSRRKAMNTELVSGQVEQVIAWWLWGAHFSAVG